MDLPLTAPNPMGGYLQLDEELTNESEVVYRVNEDTVITISREYFDSKIAEGAGND